MNTFSIATVVLIFGCIGANHRVLGNGRNQGSHQHMAKHTHYVPKPPAVDSEPVKSVLEEKKLIHDHDHLKEDLKEVYTEDEIFKMTTDEIEFHYFKLHDYDDNNLLDGVEILAAISHVVPHDQDLDLAKLGEGVVLTVEQQRKLQAARDRQTEQVNHFIKMIDRMILDSDKDKDGYINYQEYTSVRRPDGI